MKRFKPLYIVASAALLFTAACTDTSTFPAPDQAPSRNLVVPGDSTGGGATTQDEGTCVDGAQRFTSTGVQTCTDGEWRGGQVGSGGG